jgi:hypothetical protein
MCVEEGRPEIHTPFGVFLRYISPRRITSACSPGHRYRYNTLLIYVSTNVRGQVPLIQQDTHMTSFDKYAPTNFEFLMYQMLMMIF